MSEALILIPQKLAYSLVEAYQAIGVGRSTFYDLINKGEIETFKIVGKGQHVRAEVLQAFIDRKSGRAPAKPEAN